MTRAAILAIAAALTLAWALAAKADPCPAPGAAWLRVIFEGDVLTPSLRARVLEQLGADLRAHGMAVCQVAAEAAAEGAPPLATITLSLSPEAVLSLEVGDAVTGKRMLRDLPLRAVPRDALGLSIALAAQELLHASWIEAALVPPPATPAPPDLPPVPQGVREVDAAEVARAGAKAASQTAHANETAGAPAGAGVAREGASTTEIALLAAGDATTSGESDLGGDLRLAWGRRLTVGVRAGFRVNHDASAPHGTVRGDQLLVGAGLAYAVVPREARAGVEVGVRADLVDVQFSGVAGPGAQGTSGAQLGAVASGRVGGWVGVGGPWRLVGDAAAGVPLRPVTASDAGRTVTGLSGAVFGLAFGLGLLLP